MFQNGPMFWTYKVSSIYMTFSIVNLIEWSGKKKSFTNCGWRRKGRDAYVLENLVPCRTTFSTASKKSRSVATFRRARIANIPAYDKSTSGDGLSRLFDVPLWRQIGARHLSYWDIVVLSDRTECHALHSYYNNRNI